MSWLAPINALPIRDPWAYDGVRDPVHPPLAPVVLHPHTHRCPDGTPVRCLSQWIRVLGTTVDQWEVGGYIIATSARLSPPETPPDFGWLDVIASRAA